jgi:hypothetical protein
VLLHDDRPELAPTAEPVDAVLEELDRRLWPAVTVSELLGRCERSSKCPRQESNLEPSD